MELSKIIKLEPGHYVVAVSGGVDSMALMHVISRLHHQRGNDLKFTVAHFDHGIRDDSHLDRLLVHEEADRLKLPYVYEEASLGPLTSEDQARQARYQFLKKVQYHANARAILTAHHHDDVVETALLNLIRGTGRKGMSSLGDREGVLRPFVGIPKAKLKTYAEANGLVWREDSTNYDQKYRRNYIRHSIIGKLKQRSPSEYRKLLSLIRRQQEVNKAIDKQLEVLLHLQPSRKSLRRSDVISLPYDAATELVAEWLRQNGKRNFNRWLIDRLTVCIRTSRPNTEFLIDSNSKASFGKHVVSFVKV